MTASDYRITIIDSIEQFSKERWQNLAKDAGPFLSYEFLHALERSGSCCNESGWQPCHIAIAKGQHEAANLVIPGYLILYCRHYKHVVAHALDKLLKEGII